MITAPALANTFLRWLAIGGRLGLDLLLPPTCLTCPGPVQAPGQLCISCFAKTNFVTDPCCVRCSVPFASAGQGGRDMTCPNCRELPPAWRQARAALRYDDQARRIILPFKYNDRVEVARALAGHMRRAGSALLESAELIVPVPLHRSRLRTRRYNQSALLAHALARLSQRPMALDALLRTRATESLQNKSCRERAREVENAFAVRIGRERLVFGRRILLIDDVLTSGATANACARALLAGGAAQVDLLVAARVPDPKLA
jgi:ComF family protein